MNTCRTGHKPVGWKKCSASAGLAETYHMGRRMDPELRKAEEGAQFGSAPKQKKRGERTAPYEINGVKCKTINSPIRVPKGTDRRLLMAAYGGNLSKLR